MESHQCIHGHVEEIGSTAMPATKRSAGVTPEVNLRKHVAYKPPPSANKAAHSGFEPQRRCHQKSQMGYQCPHERDSCSPKNILKKFMEMA